MAKKTKRIVLISLVIFITAGAIWAVTAALHPKDSTVQGKALYHCPMHPTYTSDRPGDCPICGMRLVKIEQTETVSESSGAQQAMPGKSHADHLAAPDAKQICLSHDCAMLKEGKICPMLIIAEDGTIPECPVCKKSLSGKELIPVEQPKDIIGYTAVTLSSAKQQIIGIRTSPVLKEEATKTIRTVGKIAYDPELYQAEEEYLQAQGALKKAKESNIAEIQERAEALVEGTHTRLAILGLSDALIKEIETAGKPDKSLILAKAGGTVWMYAPIYEQELDVVKPGQVIEAEAPSIKAGKIFFGKVRSIDPILDPQTRSVRIRAVLDNAEGLLKPNVYVNAEIQIRLGEQLLIPENAVLDSGERKIAFVAVGKGIFAPRLLTLGPQLKDHFVVVSGVAEGEEVVEQAAFFVDSESKLKAAIGQASGAHAGHGG